MINYAKFYLFWEGFSKIFIKEGVEEHADVFSVLKGLIWSKCIWYLEQNEDQNAAVAESSGKNDSPECVVRSLHQWRGEIQSTIEQDDQKDRQETPINSQSIWFLSENYTI